MGKCQLCESCTFERNQGWNSTARLLASSKPSWKPIINHMGSFGGPEANDRVPLAALPRLPHQLPPSSLRSQANKQLEPHQNTSRHTRDPTPSHVDLLHPDLHLPVALDMAQHSNNRRSSGARPPPPPLFPLLRDINRWQVPVDQQHPSRFHHAPTASATYCSTRLWLSRSRVAG